LVSATKQAPTHDRERKASTTNTLSLRSCLSDFKPPLLPENQDTESVEVAQVSSGLFGGDFLGPGGLSPFSVYGAILPKLLDNAVTGTTG